MAEQEKCPECGYDKPAESKLVSGYGQAKDFGPHIPGSFICQLNVTKARIAELEAIVDKLQALPTKVCLCGSTRFMEAFFAAGWELTLMGQIVLSVGVCKHANADGGHGGEALGPEVAARLDDLHKRKIDLADWVLVLNIEGYIGDSTRSEMEYAKAIGKPTRMLFAAAIMPPRDTPPDRDEYQSWDTVAAATREAAEAARKGTEE